ncbi:MAG: 4Fe-4S dicluster domain-containing protein [Pseudomonadota bacterium]
MRFQKIVQAISLGAFVLLLLWAAYPETYDLPLNFFLTLDPVIAITTLIASREFQNVFLIAFVVILSGLVVGRAFCGYVCPMGTTIDLLQRVIYPKSTLKNPRSGYDFNSGFRCTKYYILIIVICAATGGLSLAFLVAPMSLITRFYGLVVYPIFLAISDLAIELAYPLYGHFPEIQYLQISRRIFATNFWVAGFMIFISALAIKGPRFWCSYLCPAGAALALFSRRPIFRRTVDSSCTGCGRCVRNCPTNSIRENPRETAHTECLTCLKCQEICPEKAISFNPLKRNEASTTVITDTTRRGLLLSSLSGLATAALVRTGWNQPRLTGQERAVTPADLIRPPGAMPEPEFLRLCVRCGLCMKACATNTLQPIWFKAGLEGLFSPALAPRLAACATNCSICGSVCPTSAIRELPLDEKLQVKIGTAWIDRQSCLVWNQDKKCLVCDEVCPYNAITFQPAEGRRNSVPFVHANRCTGCGWCENKCPVEGLGAIRIAVVGEVRLASGSYIEKAKEYGFQFRIVDKTSDRVAPDTFDSSVIEEGAENLRQDPAVQEQKLPSGITFE